VKRSSIWLAAMGERCRYPIRRQAVLARSSPRAGRHSDRAQLDPQYFGTQNAGRVGSVRLAHSSPVPAVGALWTAAGHFSASEARVLSAIADIVSAIQRLYLVRGDRANLSICRAARIDAANQRQPRFALTLNLVVEQLINQLRVDAADVLLLDSAARTLDYAAGRGFGLPMPGHSR